MFDRNLTVYPLNLRDSISDSLTLVYGQSEIFDKNGVINFNTKFRSTRWGKYFGSDLNFFVQNEAAMMLEYGEYVGIQEIFDANSNGIETGNDELMVLNSKSEMRDFVTDLQSTETDDVLRARYGIKDKANWKLSKIRTFLRTNGAKSFDFQEINYRPFDVKWTCYDNKLLARSRKPFMDSMLQKNLALVSKRQIRIDQFSHIFLSSIIGEAVLLESAFAKAQYFPLYRNRSNSANQSQLLEDATSNHNLQKGAIDEFSKKLNLKFSTGRQSDLEKTFGPEDIFYYTYAVFHSPTYRLRYAEQLKIDFPRLPITSDKELFKQLVGLGNELVNLHLLGENPFDYSKTILDESSKWDIKIGGTAPANLEEWKVSDVRYDEKEKRVYVNARQYFEGIEKDVWEFMIGGYQVCEKWLKDRKKAERVLSTDDLKHYMKIVVSLRETLRIMDEIDKHIPAWPIK